MSCQWNVINFTIPKSFKTLLVIHSINYVAAYRELKPADESELDYDNQLIVLKRGGTTGQTFGRLIDKCYSPSVNPPVDNIAWGLGRFYFFDRCFAVEDINGPFFNLGDSGSGVFLTENEHPTKPLGIAFAKLEYGQITVVCRIDQVTKAFNLRLYEIAEPMDTSLQMQWWPAYDIVEFTRPIFEKLLMFMGI